MPMIEALDPMQGTAGGGLTSYGVFMLITRVASTLKKADLKILIQTLQNYLDDYPQDWKKEYDSIEDVFTLWEKLAMERSIDGHSPAKIPVIKSLRERTGWNLLPAKETVEEYIDALRAKKVERLSPNVPKWFYEDANPNHCITAVERKQIWNYRLNHSRYDYVINPQTDHELFSIVDGIQKRTGWSLIEVRRLFDEIIERMDEGHITVPPSLLAREEE